MHVTLVCLFLWFACSNCLEGSGYINGEEEGKEQLWLQEASFKQGPTKKTSSKKTRASTSTSSRSSSTTSSSPSSSSSSKSASAEAHSGQLRYRPWSAQGPVYIGETFQDPKDGTIIRVAHSSNGSRLNDVRKEVDKKWSRKHYCCNDVSCRICADYCRTTRANLCLSVVKSMRKVEKPNGPKFKQIVDSILRNR